MKVTIDGDRCQGHGRCYEIAPNVFTDDDRGHGCVIGPVVPEGEIEAARSAISACPEAAIGAID